MPSISSCGCGVPCSVHSCLGLFTVKPWRRAVVLYLQGYNCGIRQWPVGSGQRYQILLHVFARCASQKTHGHARIARETREILACPNDGNTFICHPSQPCKYGLSRRSAPWYVRPIPPLSFLGTQIKETKWSHQGSVPETRWSWFAARSHSRGCSRHQHHDRATLSIPTTRSGS